MPHRFELRYKKEMGGVVTEEVMPFPASTESVSVVALNHAINLSQSHHLVRDFELIYPDGDVIKVNLPTVTTRDAVRREEEWR